MKNLNQKPKDIPLAYFITFTCYGTWLHGSKEKSVDKFNNIPLSPYVLRDENRNTFIQSQLIEAPLVLNIQQRLIVLESIKNTCVYYNWNLLAAHVRTNHIHLVIQSDKTPEYIMRNIKAYSSRDLNNQSQDRRGKYWTRHGSTRYLWKSEHVYRAIQYVVLEQGHQGAVYKHPEYSLDFSELT